MKLKAKFIYIRHQALHKRLDYIRHKKLHDKSNLLFRVQSQSVLEKGLRSKVLAINVSKLTTIPYLAG